MTYETNVEIPTLSKVRKLEREKQEKDINEKSKNLLLKAISFYNDTYPLSTHENVWEKPKIEIKIGNKTLEKELNNLNEKKLRSLYDILTYFHDERQMNKIEDHASQNRVLKLVRKIVPGGNFLDELYELYKKQKKINNQIKILEDKLIKERNKLINKLEKNTEKNIQTFTCSVDTCKKVCKSSAGLKSHMRIHERTM